MMLHELGQGTPAGANNRVKRLILKSFVGIIDEYKNSKDSLQFVPTSPPKTSSKRGHMDTSQPEPKKVCHDKTDRTGPSAYPSVSDASIQNAAAFLNSMYNKHRATTSMLSTAMPTTSMPSSTMPATSIPITSMLSTSMPSSAMPTASMPSRSTPLQNVTLSSSFIGSGQFNQNWASSPGVGQMPPYPSIQQSENLYIPSTLDQDQLYGMQQSQLWHPSAHTDPVSSFGFQPNSANQQHNFDHSSFAEPYQNGGSPQNRQNSDTSQPTENATTQQPDFYENNTPYSPNELAAPSDPGSAPNVRDTGTGSQAPNAQM